MNLVHEVWSIPSIGLPLQVVISKLKNLKKALKSWNCEVFSDLNSNISRKSTKLRFVHSQMSDLGCPEEHFLTESCIHHDLDVLLRRQKCFFRDRSIVKWDRHIEDCIALTSDCISVLHKKCYGGNMAMKIAIQKAFDTLDWKFLCRVLKAFGFSQTFMDWIVSILGSSRLYSLINGSPTSYFSYSRGVRQGYPLSPFLFGIAEDFLRRLLSRMVESDQLLHISSLRGFSAPTQLLYTDDVLVFCRGTIKNLKSVMLAFRVYGSISGQLVNWRGKPRKVILMLIADKILSKFAKWKGKSLSLCRVALSLVWRSVYDANNLGIGCIRNCVDDLLILHRFGFYGRPGKAPVIKSVVWSPPAPGWIKVNTYGVALGSLGVGGCGGVFRTCRSFVKACFAVPLGQVFAFEAELLTASLAINYAYNLGWHRI
ncbi:hypothetical protein Ddye_024549 [Dipteronia dyeriana]|uniref:Reverse transcriptase domain-containing protein n=1 Tax=Dipteronia dyeriana TaxID=168575 RepID=A0AAD9TVL8_9ROSI|nr:hypothetical protein Ddye_024549 [Dipteronia dyeriana]